MGANPEIVTLMDQIEPVWQLPFPAITICPETKVKQSALNLTHFFNMATKTRQDASSKDSKYAESMDMIRSVSQVCDNSQMEQMITGTRTENTSIYDNLRRISPTFAETASTCKFQGELSECEPFFHETWTDDGLCFTFNLLNEDDIISNLVNYEKHPLIKSRVNGSHTQRIWTLDNGYDRQGTIDPKAYPYEILGTGQLGAFVIVLRLMKSDFDYICRGPVIGHKISLHLPGDLPQMGNHYIRLPNEKDTLITIEPKVVRTADSLRGYSPNARGCFYPNERTLKYFKEYTQRNCELECLTDHTFENCRCVKFSMPRDEGTAICDFSSLECMLNSQQSIIATKMKNISSGGVDSCNCLPSCTQITYDYEISQSSLYYSEMMTAFDAAMDIDSNASFTRLTVIAKENYFQAVIRRELHSHTDLLALCGGVLSLFFGASLCSFLELFMYFGKYFPNGLHLVRVLLNYLRTVKNIV